MNLLSNAIDALDDRRVEKLEGIPPNPPRGEGQRAEGDGEGRGDGGDEEDKSSISLIQHRQSKIQNPHILIHTSILDTHSVQIRIADSGPGIPAEVRDRIFEPFFTTKPVGKGTGLGLSISYEIVVEKHGGNFQCLSTPGEGTEFVITIPLKQAETLMPEPVLVLN
jgi:signal transduction histidine kinase